MIYKPKQVARVVFGLFLFALGIVMTVNANLGVSPWDVFHQGLSKTFGITLGRANIITGFFIIGLDVVLGQTIGWATIMNMLLIGTFIDILMLNNLVPVFDSFIPSLIMLLLGVLIEGYGCYIYISGGMGAGPRDGLMVVLTRRTGRSVRLIKSAIEVIVVTVGIFLGGKFGIGTLIMALFGGAIFQFAFKTVNFKVNQVQHRFIQDDLKLLKGGS
ncbi:YczE/YyaS/YitT family protein [Gudongella oleilytica]|jgi:uncharacterized membrane protein YczE|uniref:YczE/YyaS/YitT family protein n=1 Tax=Gudongella oleilytica TaxID=1582259 RepID=UPI000FF8B439|nr:hypothetical protein [Gudongella oleilytica]